MYPGIRDYISMHFSLFLIGAAVVGMVMPGIDLIPKWLVLPIIASVIFLSTSKIAHEDFLAIQYSRAILFTLLRFIFLPVLMFIAMNKFIPTYSSSIFLLALLPAGVMSPVLVHVMGGNITLALGIVVISSLMAPITLPLAFAFFGNSGVTLDAMSMFWNLAIVIVFPMFLYGLCARHMSSLTVRIKQNASCFTVLLMSGCMLIVVAQRREVLFQNIPFLVKSLLVMSLAFASFYVMGWLYPSGKQKRTQIAYALTSGAMNNMLGISIAFLYFPPEVSLFMVLTEVPWVLSLPLFQYLLERKYKTSEHSI